MMDAMEKLPRHDNSWLQPSLMEDVYEPYRVATPRLIEARKKCTQTQRVYNHVTTTDSVVFVPGAGWIAALSDPKAA